MKKRRKKRYFHEIFISYFQQYRLRGPRSVLRSATTLDLISLTKIAWLRGIHFSFTSTLKITFYANFILKVLTQAPSIICWIKSKHKLHTLKLVRLKWLYLSKEILTNPMIHFSVTLHPRILLISFFITPK